jgi:hypothetical protein
MQINRLRRREFITLLGSAATASAMLAPVATRAQQRVMPVMGLLSATSLATHGSPLSAKAWKEAGVVEGRNVAIEYRPCRSMIGSPGQRLQ